MADLDPMSYFEASIILVFGVILPTVDCWSDIWLSIIILLGEPFSECFGYLFETERQIIGGVTLAFPILSFLFISFHWWRLENINREGGSGRLKTLILLILQKNGNRNTFPKSPISAELYGKVCII